MAGCEGGYICGVCGKPVAEMHESALYLRFVMGCLHPDELWTAEEQHLPCRPELAQHVRDEEFLAAHGELRPEDAALDRDRMPAEERARRDELTTRAYRRLLTLPGGRHILDYPLPDAERTWSKEELGEHWIGSGL
jgi:hypothetical protein